MDTTPKRFIELRLLVVVVTDLTAPSLAKALASSVPNASVAQAVAHEITAKLESLPYIDSVIVSPL